MKLVGYGIVGRNESQRYLKNTLECFKKHCEDTLLCLNNPSGSDLKMVNDYSINYVIEDREWGKFQPQIKEDFLRNHVSKLNPDWLLCLDADEVIDESFSKEKLEELGKLGESFYTFIVNLKGKGYDDRTSFPNIRLWKWSEDLEFENKNVHCGLAPKWAYYYGQQSPFIVWHSGLKLKKDRMAKVERYKKYDSGRTKLNDPTYYNCLEDNYFKKLDKDEVRKQVQEHFESLNLKYKKPKTKEKSEYATITNGRITFQVEEKDKGRYLNRDGYTEI